MAKSAIVTVEHATVDSDVRTSFFAVRAAINSTTSPTSHRFLAHDSMGDVPIAIDTIEEIALRLNEVFVVTSDGHWQSGGTVKFKQTAPFSTSNNCNFEAINCAQTNLSAEGERA